MEAAPSVPFHERAPDLMTEEDLHSNQLEAEESVNRLQAAHWQLPIDLKESVPAGKADRADIAFGVPPGRVDRAGPAYGVSLGQAERAKLASEIPAERAGVPFSTSAERAQKGETSYGLQDVSAYGELTSSDTEKQFVLTCKWTYIRIAWKLVWANACKGTVCWLGFRNNLLARLHFAARVVG